MSESASPKVSFPAFFFLWAELKRWEVPDIHWLAVNWLANRGRLSVLRCFRGFGKSSLLAVYNAWRYYCDPAYRILHQGDQDKTAYKTSRDTLAVLQRHPLTKDGYEFGIRGNKDSFWWGPGSSDERNPSMQAAGILTSITSSRCDEVQNDDVEVPKNITNIENRAKMRARLGEQVHCMVPNAPMLYVGTPHTHDSLYDEMEAMGADCLTIKMFEREHRIELADKREYVLPFAPEFVLSGIGKHSRALRLGRDYTLKGSVITFKVPPMGLVDCYSGSSWPERFNLDEMEFRRRQTKTINEWDSQYQLHSKPVHDIRLNPDRIAVYDAEPTWRRANGELLMMLGGVRIVAASVRWDPSSGKVKSDVSAVAAVLQGEGGERYLHRVLKLTGDVAEFGSDGKTIVGGQVYQLCDLVEKFHLPRVTVETNGIGTFAPAILKAALKQRKLTHPCGVTEEARTENKNKIILETFEPLLSTHDQLWAHTSVMDSEDGDQGKGLFPTEMRAWNPAVRDQPDDYLDAAAGAISETPERIIGKVAPGDGIPSGSGTDSWRPSSGVHEVVIEAGIVE